MLENPSQIITPESAHRRQPLLLFISLLPIAAGLIVYSQTRAFVWDEGFHLIAAQSIAAGKRPYIDFCFPQTPLNAYWNAELLNIFGETWRITHLFAALFVAGAVLLTGEYVYSRFPLPRWRFACALAAAVLVGTNNIVVQFGPVAQAYGIGLFLGFAAFRAAVAAPDRVSILPSFTAGFLGAGAAGCSLLTAPIAPVLLVWLLRANRRGSRLAKCTAFLIGALISAIPVLWLFYQGPRQTLFNVLQYQTLYRRADWPGATVHDIDVLSDWLISTQTLVLAALAVAGLSFLRSCRDWEPARRSEFYLAAWLAAVLGVFIATAHPTFSRYFIFLVPFVSVLAVIGLYSISSRLGRGDRPLLPAMLVIGFFTLAAAKAVYEQHDATTWKDYEEIARKTAVVTPLGSRLFADEVVYFLLRWTPPSGMEFSYSHKLELPVAEEELFHVISDAELKAQIEQGEFATVQTCRDETIDQFNLEKLFPHHVEVQDCDIFWGKVKHGAVANDSQ